MGSYVHNQYTPGVGTQLCLTRSSAPALNDKSGSIADGLAMQILGMKPTYYTRADIPADLLTKETESTIQSLGEAVKGKPKEILDKMIAGKMRGFFEDNVLYE